MESGTYAAVEIGRDADGQPYADWLGLAELDEIAVAVAGGMITRVRDDGPDELAGYLDTLDVRTARAALVVLARAMPEWVPMSSLTAPPRPTLRRVVLPPAVDELVECGTPAGFAAHIERDQQICDPCDAAYRRWAAPRFRSAA